MAAQKRLLNLKTKFLLIVLVPVLMTFIVIAIYSRLSMNTFGNKISNQSTEIVTKMAEQAVVEKARTVARELRLALAQFPDLPPEQLNDTPLIHQTAIQKVGRTGYTVLWGVPAAGSVISPTWIHPDSSLVGKDTPTLVQKRLGSRYQDWFTIYKGCYNQQESKGYYLWEENGVVRQKFLACTPIPDTPYAVSATTYLDEFLAPVKNLETEIHDEFGAINLVNLATMASGLFIFILCTLLGISRITRQIVTLTQAIEDVSLGKIEQQISIVKSNDELQDLSEAFERMRTGVKFLMEKLKKVREQQTAQG